MRELVLVVLAGCSSSSSPAGHGGSAGSGSVTVAPPLHTALAPAVLADVPDQSPFALALDDTAVYWTDRIGGTLWRIAKHAAGAKPEQLATNLDEPRWLAVRAHDVLVSTEAGVIAVPLDRGGKPRTVMKDLRCPLVATGDVVYGAGDHAAVRIGPRGELTTITEVASPSGVAASKSVVIALLGQEVWRVDPQPAKLATLPAEVMHAAVTDRAIYVALFGEPTIYTLPLDGGEPAVFVTGTDEVDSLAADDRYVWWTSMPQNAVYRAAVARPVVETVATEQSRALDVAVDADAVYWITWKLALPGEGKIMRASR